MRKWVGHHCQGRVTRDVPLHRLGQLAARGLTRLVTRLRQQGPAAGLLLVSPGLASPFSSVSSDL